MKTLPCLRCRCRGEREGKKGFLGDLGVFRGEKDILAGVSATLLENKKKVVT
jgi:hypothetical protein